MQRKFDKRLLIRSKGDSERIVRGIYSPTLLEWCDILEDFIDESRKRVTNKLAMFRLQIRILMDIVETSEAISLYRKLLDDPNEQRKHIPEPEPIEESHFQSWKDELTANEILLSALRDIGDGIAWRSLNFNRPLLYTMSRNESPGPLVYSQGLINEMHALGDIVNDTEITKFVVHGITNFARLGDITAIYEDGRVEFIEVKSKENPRGIKWANRVNRQVLRLDNLTKIANDGLGIVDGQGIVVKIIAGAPKLNLKLLRSLLAELKNTGFAARVPNSYLAIVGVDLTKIRKLNPSQRERDICSSIKNGKEKLLHISSLDFFEFSPHRAPLSIYPFEPRDIAELLLGKIQLSFNFNYQRFFSEIEKHNWTVSSSMFDNPVAVDPAKDPFCVVRSGPLSIGLPITFAARAILEGMSIDSIIRECEAIRKEGPNNSHNAVMYGFAEEARHWS